MKKIAIIDDDLTLCNAWSQWLARSGYDPVILGYGKDFLEVIEQEKPDLMLIDIILPGMNGVNIAKAVKEHPVLKNTPVVLMSAVVMKTEIESFGTIADGYLSKPFKMGEMLSVLERFLKKEDYDDERYDTKYDTKEFSDTHDYSDTKEFTKPPYIPSAQEQNKEPPSPGKKDATGHMKRASYNVSYDGAKVEMIDIEDEFKDNPFENEKIGNEDSAH